MRTVVRKHAVRAAVAAVMGLAVIPASAAGLLDSLFGKSVVMDAAADKQRAWRLDEFTSVRVVEKEAAAPANQHPATVDATAMRAQLASVEARVRSGNEALFDPAELDALAPVLVRAFALAGPNDDVLLLSTARRGGLLAAPFGVTARLFVQGDALQLIVHDARYEFIEAYRRTHVSPKFTFGSRSKPGNSTLRSEAANPVRADWLAFPLRKLTAASVSAPPAHPSPAVPAAVAPATLPAPAAAVPAPAPGSLAAVGDEIEQRLVTLKRLRDKNLITEEEYQQKRREVLQKL